MTILLLTFAARLGPRARIAVIVAALLTAGAAFGWAMSTIRTTSSAAVDELSELEALRRSMVRKAVEAPVSSASGWASAR